MLDLSAPHTGFVVASYVVSGVTILGLVVATVVRLKAQERKLAALQRRGKRGGGADDGQ
ncbi:MAG: heme exporter protein CcmD [Pseudomonadota bacterium]|nr:heme exporter protein CcmD [Pseudomonadota bacterium]